MRMHWMLVALVALSLMACAKGKDGEDGNAYGYLEGTSGVTAVDFSEIGITDSSVIYHKRYQLTPGNHTVYWLCTSTWYSWPVTIEIQEGDKGKDASMPLVGKATDGGDGKDHLYYAQLISSTAYWTDSWVDHGSAPSTASVDAPALESDASEPSIPNLME